MRPSRDGDDAVRLRGCAVGECRPPILVADKTRGKAQDKAANAFLALATTYLISKQWSNAIPAVTFGVRGLQLVLIMTDIPDAGPGSDKVPDAPWSKARWEQHPNRQPHSNQAFDVLEARFRAGKRAPKPLYGRF